MGNRRGAVRAPNPRLPEILDTVHELRGAGKTLAEIATILNERGVAKLQGTTPWTYQNIYTLLSRCIRNTAPEIKSRRFDETIEPWMFKPLPWTPPTDERVYKDGA